MKEYFVWLLKIFTLLTIVFIAVPVLLLLLSAKAIGNQVLTPSLNANGVIAVVDVNGIIMDSKEVVEKLYKFSNDSNVKGIILKVNSPGGAIAPSQDIYNTVLELKAKKPIFAVMDSMAASGGYYVSAPCTKIFAQKGTLTASIGVISQFTNLKSLIDWFGVKIEVIKSGKLKDFGSSFRDMTDEERAYWTNQSDRLHKVFIDDIARVRPIDKAQLISIADGRVLSGVEAKDVKLIDDFGGIYEASKVMYKDLGIKLKDGELPTIYYPEDKLKGIKKFLESSANAFSFLNSGAGIAMAIYL